MKVNNFKINNINLSKIFFILTATYSFLISGLSLTAQNLQEKRPIIISAVISSKQEEENSSIHNLFMEILKYEFNLSNLTLSVDEYPDVLIRGRYDIKGNILLFSLDADLTGEDKTLYSITSQEELQFNLDKIILNHARDLTRAVADHRDQNSDIYSITAVSELKEPVSDEVPPVSEIQADPYAPENNKYMFAADIGLFLAAGEAGRYFKTGLMPSFYAGYYIKPWLNAGITAGIMYFKAEGYATTAQGLVFLTGPAVRIKAPYSNRFNPGLRFEATGAFFKITPESGEAVNKLIPSIETGMTVDIFMKKLILLTAFDITLFFDKGSLVYGFTPRIGAAF